MKKRSRVTEEDLRVTEVLIGRSFSRLKRSAADAAAKAPSEILKPASNAIREHPVASTAAAASMGLIAYEVMKLLSPRAAREGPVRQAFVEGPAKADLWSQIIATALPFVASYIQQELSKKAPSPRY